METTRYFPNSLARLTKCLMLLVLLITSVAHSVVRAENAVIQVSSVEDASTQSEWLSYYQQRLVQEIALLAGYQTQFDSPESSVVGATTDSKALELVSGQFEGLVPSPRLYAGVRRTQENENQYYWVTAIAAFACEKAVSVCSDNTGAGNGNVSLSYLALTNSEENKGLAESLSLAASEYKVSADYKALQHSVDEKLGASQHVFSFGILSFVGELNVDASDLWIISDLVPLFSEVGEHNELEGIAADFVRDVLDDAGIASPILYAPWQRIAKEAISKPNVLVFSIVLTAEREPVFHWISPISRNLHGLFGIDKRSYRTIDDVPSTMRVGTLKNDYRFEVASERGFHTLAYGSWKEIVNALLSNKVDVIFASQGAIDFGCVDKARCNDIKQVAPYKVSSAYLALSKLDTSLVLVEMLKLTSAKIKKSKKFRQTSQQWSEAVHNNHNVAHHIENGVVHLWKKQK
jgi:polar amino acid transport system substrate-binding protein